MIFLLKQAIISIGIYKDVWKLRILAETTILLIGRELPQIDCLFRRGVTSVNNALI